MRRRAITLVVAVALMFATMARIPLPEAGAVTPPDADVTAIAGGLTQLSNFSHGLAETGSFAQLVPELSVTPGEDAALGFSDLFDKLLVGRIPANAVHLADLAGISTGAGGVDLEANGRHAVLTATPTAAPQGSTTEQLKLDFTVTRTVDSGLSILSASPAVQLGASKGVQTTFTLTGSLTVAFDTAKNFFYVVRTLTTPSLKVDVSASIPDITQVDTALGILAMKLTASTFQLNVHYTTAWFDSNNDGKLAFSEPASGNTTTPGELTQAANTAAIVSTAFASSPPSTAAGQLDLDTAPSSIPGLTLPSIPTTVSITSSDLSAGPPTITTSTLDTRLVKFNTLGPKDLATFVARMLFLVRSAEQAHITSAQQGDVALPLIDANLADTVRPEELLLKFLSDPTVIDQTTGQPQFSSIQAFFDALNNETLQVPANGPTVATETIDNASYDDATSHLSFDIAVTRTGGTNDVVDPSSQGNDKNFGTVQVGNTTRAVTGIRNAATADGVPPATTSPSYTLHLPVVLDLRPPVTGAACASANDPSNPTNAACPFSVQLKNGNQVIGTQIVSSLPLTPERLLLNTGATLLDADTTVTGTITNVRPSVGMAGFVQAGFDTGTITISKASGAQHLMHIALASQGLQRVSTLLTQLQSGTPSTAISYDTRAQLSASLHGFVPGLTHFFDGADPTLTATSDDITQASHLQVAGADLKDRLHPLDFGGDDNASSLRGTAANALGALRDTLQKLTTMTVGAAQERISAKVQLLGRSLDSLLSTGELDTALTSISNNANVNEGPPESLQELATRVSTLLGNSSALSFHMDGAHPAAHLVLDVDYKRILDNDPSALLGLRFTSGGKTLDLVGVNPNGSLQPKGGTDAHLALALPLDGSAPTSASDVLVQSDGSVAFSPDVSFTGNRTATIGALATSLGPNAKIEAHPRVTLAGSGANFVSLKNWALSATAAAPTGDPNVTCPDSNAGRAVCADMPALASSFTVDLNGDNIYFGDNLSSITPDNSTIGVPSGLALAQQNNPLDLTKIKNGLTGGLSPYLEDVSHALDNASANGKLPFIGNDLQQGSDFINKLKQHLTDAINNLTINNASPKASDVQNALNALTLPESQGFTITATITCSGVPCIGTEDASAVDGVEFSMTVGQGSVTPDTPCNGANCPTTAAGKIDLGIPGVRFMSDSSPAVHLGWQLKLTFGFDQDHGFFLDASNPANNDLKLALGLNLPDFSGEIGFVTIDATDMNGGNGSGTTADAQHAKPEFAGVFDIGLQQMNGKSKLGIADIASADIGSLVHIGLSANANVQYDLAASVSSDFPGISAHLGLTWNWSSAAPDDNSGLAIEFDHVSLDLGPFFEKLLGPVHDTIKKTISPLKPVVDAIDGPIPGLSDVSHLVGGGDISVLTLMKLYGTFNGTSDQVSALERVLRLVKSIVDFTASGKVELGGFGVDPDKAMAGVPTPDQIGSFLKNLVLAQAQQLLAEIQSKCAKCADALNQIEQNIGLDSALDPNIGFHFPVLDHPESLAGLLLGQDIPLVTYDTGPLHNHFDFAVSIGPLGLPIFIDIGIQATVDMRFVAGFDTYGIRKAIESGSVASILDGLYLQDFDEQGHERPEISIHDTMVYIDAKFSLVVVQAGIRGQINLTANLDLHDTDSPQHPDEKGTGNGDGKVRFSEIGRDAQGNFNPSCIFDSSGDISAQLVLFFKIDFGLFSEEWDDVLASARILNLDHNCDAPAPPPTLAHVVGGDLIVNAGKFGTTGFRGDSHWDNGAGGDLTKPPNPPLDGNETQPTEVTTVRALHDENGTFLGFGVDLLGYHQDFLVADNPGLNRAILDATNYDGREIVNFLGDGTGTDPNATKTTVHHFDRPAVIIGGKQDDQIKVDGTAPAGSSFAPSVAVDGGLGNDLIITGDGNDLIAGGGGNDNIHAGYGDDQVAGDAALSVGANYAASLNAMTVAESVGSGGTDGDDSIDAGLGADVVNGGGGKDHIVGGQDDGRAVTDSNNASLRDNNNLLIGGSGDDIISGGPHHDTIYGDFFETLNNGTAIGSSLSFLSYNDHIDTGFGNDTVFGGAGADTIVGRSDAADATKNPPVVATSDTIFGNGGTDNITGGNGDDTISGGPDGDTIVGGVGKDSIHGDAGDDQIGGDRVLSAPKIAVGRFSALQPSSLQDGDDTIYGDAGVDTIYGGGGNDTIFGDQGNNACPAPSSTNPIVWPAPAEVVTAGDGDDKINGGPGNDIMSGEGGGDTITGASGTDRICGHAGIDNLSGGTDDDLISGGSDGDNIYGDDGNDHLEGNNGSDTISGGPGTDQIIGGTTVAGSSDTGDTIYGDADVDTILGDNGTISNAVPPVVNVLDLASNNASLGGGDTIDAGAANDLAFGGLGDDTVKGGDGDDHLEGNVGSDTVYGGAGQDDILGGTSPIALAGADSSSIADVGDFIYGEDGSDVVLGDNGAITRDNPITFDGADPTDVPMVHRVVQLFGVYTGGPIVGGDDQISGGNNDDLLFGQAGSDTINGDAGNDHIEGNNGVDTLSGGDGHDDMLGGTSPVALVAGKTTSNVSDAGDTMNGNAGVDYMLGDNGNITHPLDGGGHWATSQADGSFLRNVVMLDRLTIGGNDTMNGGNGNDRMWGELGNDTMDGGNDADYMEGNVGSDVMSGGAGDDDMIGGTSPVAMPAGADATVEDDGVVGGGTRVGNHMCGYECGQATSSGDNDVIIGNNAKIDRCAAGGRDACTWATTSYGSSRDGSTSLGSATTRFVTLLGESTSETNRNANDYIEGNSGNDVLYGEDGNDVAHGDTPAQNSARLLSAWSALTTQSPDECLPVSDGNAGQDIAYGGYGDDLACGDGGDDVIIGDRATVGITPFAGATQNINSAGPPNLVASFPASGNTIYPTTLLDPTVGGNDLIFGGPGNDTMHGGAGDDFMQGDDGVRVAGQVAATGNDILFGDNGNDSIEGGPGNDHGWGGADNDDIDVIRSANATDIVPKVNEKNKALPPLFQNIPSYASRFPAPVGMSYDIDPGAQNDPTTTNGDIDYGGYNRDLLQADTLNDRLVDSYGAYNLFFVCPAAYGGSQITRALSPGILTFFQQLGQADGALGAANPATVGGGEVSIVYPATANPDNAGAAYNTTPGHFTC